MRKLLYGIFLLVLGGCASSQNTQLVTKLSTRVEQLERQTEMKDDEIKSLQKEVQELSISINRLNTPLRKYSYYSGQPASSSDTGKADEIIRVNGLSGESLQKALKKAGYYKGPVDGKIGNKTQSAIIKFQQDKGLKGDGKVGQMTWARLKHYLQ